MINDRPRPRVLFEDVPDDAFEKMKVHAPTRHRIYSEAQSLNDDVHPSDWDLLVTYASDVSSSQFRHTLSFGAISVGPFRRTQSTHAAEVAIWQGASSSVSKLVRNTVVPIIENGAKDYWTKFASNFLHWAQLDSSDLHPGIPLLTVGDEQFVLAFWNTSSMNEVSHVVSLPRETLYPELWLLELITILQVEDSDHFPPGTSWRDSSEWATSALRTAHNRVEAIEQRREDAIAQFDAELADAVGQVEREKARAERGDWRLLTEKGDQLVSAVKKALEVLGFDVEDRDSTTIGAKLEDLRVKDSSQPEWICLVEVKGYTRGVKSSDVNQVAMNPSTKFAVEYHREPDKLWHIVNGNKDVAPDRRGPTFTDSEKVIAHFTAQGGLVIDTRELFCAVRAVVDGNVDAATVRDSLQSSSGLWEGVSVS